MKNSKNLLILAISLLIAIVCLITAFFLLNKNEKLTDKNSVSVYFVEYCKQNIQSRGAKTTNNVPDSSGTKENKVKDFCLTAVRRKFSLNESKFSTAIKELLKGPSREEKREGLYTEIPATTKLIEIKESPKAIIINFSKDFESGGGSTSMSMRLKQLVNTALDAAKNKPVYLELNNKKVDFIGGEGVIVSQPLSRN